MLVLGLGASGLGREVRALRRPGHRGRRAPGAAATGQPPNCRRCFVGGSLWTGTRRQCSHSAEDRSPGLAPQAPPIFIAARPVTGISVGGEIDRYSSAHAHRAPTATRLPLAITGTAVARPHHRSPASWWRMRAMRGGGQHRPHAAGHPAERIAQANCPTSCAELSSFQLDGVRGFEPTAAAVLNVTQDHLDWHGDMATYAAAKARIFGEQADGAQPRRCAGDGCCPPVCPKAPAPGAASRPWQAAGPQ